MGNNTLLIKDTTARLVQLTELVKKRDVSVRQVLIEARVAYVDKGFEKDLGVQFRFTRYDKLFIF